MSVLSQAFPPAPKFTASSLPSLESKTYIITGATAGVGFELAKILYSRSATVYIVARSASKLDSAISAITKAHPSSTGRLLSIMLDLSDLTTIVPAANQFLDKEDALHGLVLNAGVMRPPEGSQSKQGHELQMGTNCLGGYLLERTLEPLLIKTSLGADPGFVRVVWLSSIVQVSTPKGGIIWDEDKDQPKLLKNQMDNYMMSKVGNNFFANDVAQRLGKHGIISVAVNPGLMKTELQRDSWLTSTLMGIVFKGPEYGACSELFGLLSPEVTLEKNGSFIIPWGRFGIIPDHLTASMRDKSEGGTGVAKRFIEWCEKTVRPFEAAA